MENETLAPNPPAETLPAVIRPHNVTLYDAEETLNALIESEETVSPEQQLEYLQDLATASQTAIRKRDGVNYFLVNCEAAIAAAGLEISRLQARRDRCQAAIKNVGAYVLRIIRNQDIGPDGKYPKLKGNTVTFSAQKNPASVEITDEAQVPSEHKRLLIQIPAVKWEQIMDSVDMEFRAELLDVVKRQGCDILKTPIKAALDAGGEVPGARMAEQSWRLVRR